MKTLYNLAWTLTKLLVILAVSQALTVNCLSLKEPLGCFIFYIFSVKRIISRLLFRFCYLRNAIFYVWVGSQPTYFGVASNHPKFLLQPLLEFKGNLTTSWERFWFLYHA